MKEIYELMERFHGLSIGEMELEYQGMKIFLKKERARNDALNPEKQKDVVKEEKIIKIGNIKEENAKQVKAPLAGTFYRSPSPDQPPYVSIGQKVKKGDVLGMIEAMKMMNEITATEDGVIEEILVEDEAMVEYGQPLIVIK